MTQEIVGVGVLRVTADASGVTAEVDKAKRSVRELGGALGESTQQGTAQAQRSIAAYVQQLQASAANVGKTRAEIKLMELAQRGATEAQVEAARAAFATIDAYKAQQREARALAAAQRETEALMGRMGVSAAQTAAAMRTVPAQLTDIVTQLQGGANPFTVLLQQGGQLKDSFGGIGPALRGVASMITPVSVAVGALALTVGGFVAAVAKGEEQSIAFARALQATGGAAGITAGQYESLSRSIADSTRTSLGSTREALQTLVASGRFSGEALTAATAAATTFARATGQTATEAAQKFIGMADSVASGAESLNRQYHFLTAAQLEYIKGLDEQGRRQEALRVTFEALNGHMAAAAQNLGTLERAWNAVKGAAGAAIDAMMRIGRVQTPESMLADAERRLDALRARAKEPIAFGLGTVGRPGAQELAAQEETVRSLRQQVFLGQERAAQRAQELQREEAVGAFNKLKEGSLSKQEQMARAIANANAQADAAGASAAERAKVLASIRERYADPKVAQAAAREAREAERAAERQAESYRNLMTAIRDRTELSQKELRTRTAVDAIDRQYIATINAIERALVPYNAQQRRALLGAAEEDRAEARRVESRRAAIAAKQADAASEQAAVDALDAASEARQRANRGLREQIEELGLSARQIDAVRTERLRLTLAEEQAAIVTARAMGVGEAELSAMQGKANALEREIGLRERLTDAARRRQTDPQAGVTRAIDEYNETITHQGDESYKRLKDGITGLEERLSQFFTKGKADWKGYFAAIALEQARTQIVRPLVSAGINLARTAISSYFGGGRADGGPVSAGRFYEVNERGPELLTTGGRTYLMASQPGQVTPTSGGGMSYQDHRVTYIDSRTDQAQVAQIAAESTRRGIEAFAEQLRAQGRL